jgi:prepilin-type N-terminal cleavage/methylation domain-containing protein
MQKTALSRLQNLLRRGSQGFTLIELLVVIGILAVLLAIVLIAINPARQFAQANNTQRRSDVNAILNAIHQYMADNNGTVPAGITTTQQNIADTGADLCGILISDYLAALPRDPQLGAAIDPTACGAAYDTGYTVVQSAANNRITVTAPSAELSASISATR